MNSEQTTQYPTAGLFRRLIALVYDTLLLLALILIAGFIALPFTGGEAPRPGNPFYQTYIFVLCYLFFAWFWTRGGQTLGMRAWRLRVQNEDGTAINWSQSLLRFMCAMVSWGFLGLGYLWILVDKNNLAWHDHFSNSRIVVLPKPDKSK